MVSLFDWDENNEMLGEKYSYCCGVEVTKKDSLPTLICLSCVDRLTFAYQFKQQCISSNETLKECLEEFQRTTEAVNVSKDAKKLDTEIITIKQENGVLLQYELPIEHDSSLNWTRTVTKSSDKSVVTKAPQPRKRGRPRKYPNEQGQIDVSPYNRKKTKSPREETPALTTLLASGPVDLKQELQSEAEVDDNKYTEEDYLNNDDPDFDPAEEEEEQEDDPVVEQLFYYLRLATEFIEFTLSRPARRAGWGSGGGRQSRVGSFELFLFVPRSCGGRQLAPKKRGRPRKGEPKSKRNTDDGEDVLLKETILAYSEPIPDHILNPKPKEKKKYPKKKYVYDKTHICETCGAAFSSNASLQAHIRRHLGIKPFVCSICGYACVLNMELRRHMLRHTGVRPYQCRVCDRRFGDFGTRQKHERRVPVAMLPLLMAIEIQSIDEEFC
ncbi:Myoneurin [Eumeta japonica]|uniref:Protein hunchback n=1 Tax=Eumeta variegata TaxID=151549 RepID=A0A4C1UP17_EUMVA|nr:Myoneurin [Eumeta japonica]